MFLYHGQGTYKLKTNDSRLTDTNNSNSIKCYVSQQKGFVKYIDKNELSYNYNNWKVITPEAAHGAYSGFGNTFIGKPNEVCSQTYIFFEVKNEEEAKSLKSYLQTIFANYMLSIRKNSQHISNKTCEWIPLVPLDRIWTDNEVKKHFEFTDEIEKLYNPNVISKLSKDELYKLTIPKIKKLLDNSDIKYKSKYKKDELIELYLNQILMIS